MKPRDDYRNGDGGASSGSAEDSGGEEAGEEGGGGWGVDDAEAPRRALAALNALRKSRQHYDVVLVAGGAELPAHRALLAAHSPHLLAALALPASPEDAPAPAPARYRVEGAETAAVAALLEYVYTGRLQARSAKAARALYLAAWRLRVEGARLALADRLLRRLAPQDCLDVRALPDLPPHHLQALEAYIADNFDAVCDSGALAALPLIRMELLPATGAIAGGETPQVVADAALDWLRTQAPNTTLEDLCSRTHLVYVDGGGSLQDCAGLPAARGDTAELQEYRREAAVRHRAPAPALAPPRPLPGLELGARLAKPDCAVLAARTAHNNGSSVVTRALLVVGGRLAAARVRRRAEPPGAGSPAGAATPGAGPDARAHLPQGLCALGAAVLGGKLLACGGFDRTRVLRQALAYSPRDNAWRALPDMRSPRARFPAARLRGRVYVIGGSDGHNELDTLDVYEEEEGAGRWRGRAKMPMAASYAAAAAVEPGEGEDEDEEGEADGGDEAEAAAVRRGGALMVVGGWAAGRPLRSVLRYDPDADTWHDAPPLNTGRSQCGAALWHGWWWALGGCDAWHCLASTERRRVRGGAWSAGPALPTARRSAGAAAWRGRLVAAGGSDGACSLRRVDWLCAPHGPWAPGPDLRRARAGLALADLDDVLYAVGGFDGKEFLSCVECLYSPEGEWTSLVSPAPPTRPPATPDPPHAQEAAESVAEAVAEAVAE